MNRLRVALTEPAALIPGQELQGAVGWSISPAPQRIELRLFWHTEGKGSQDLELVSVEVLDNCLTEEGRRFAFRLPDAPFSFSGKLISLVWSVEAIAEPGHESDRADFVMAPGGQEIVL